MVEGRTLIMKDKSKATLVENYRPIACLNFSWKLFDWNLCWKTYLYLLVSKLLLYEQKGCGKGSRGTKDHLVIDQASVFNLETRIAERRFLTGLPRGYFFWGEGTAIHTQATIKPCRRPLRETESPVRLKHKLIQNIVPFWKTFVTMKMSTIFKWGLYNNF